MTVENNTSAITPGTSMAARANAAMHLGYQIPPVAGGDYGIRIVRTAADMETAQCIRHEAYVAAGGIDPRPDGRFNDVFDDRPNSDTYVLRFRGLDIGTIRTNTWTGKPGWESVPAFQVFGNRLLKHTHGERFVEMSRFAMLPGFSYLGRRSLLLLFSTAAVAAYRHHCRYIAAAVMESHIPFYESLHFIRSEAARPYPGTHNATALILMDYRASHAALASHPVLCNYITLHPPELL
jgi:hypothetical protein